MELGTKFVLILKNTKWPCNYIDCLFRKHVLSTISMRFSERTSLLEKWRNNEDQGRKFGALLTDLSKAFDCLLHDIFIAKLYNLI